MAKHSGKIVAGGALRGLRFSDLTQEQLSRAAKRYPGDVKLQRYAKAVIASAELDGNEAEPEPCLPLVVRNPVVSEISKGKASQLKDLMCWFYHLKLQRVTFFAVLLVMLVILFKPEMATACTKVLVRFFATYNETHHRFHCASAGGFVG